MKLYNFFKFFNIIILSLAISNCTIRFGNSKNNNSYDYNNPPDCPYEGEDDFRACINGVRYSYDTQVSWFEL